MKRSICMAAILALTLTACGGSGPGSTPEQTYESARSIIASENWEAICDLIPPSQLEKQEKEFEEGKGGPGAAMMAAMFGIKPDELKTMGFRQFMGKMMGMMAEKDPDKMKQMLDAEIVDTKIDGDNATITTKLGDKEEKVRLIKENGLWYMGEFGN